MSDLFDPLRSHAQEPLPLPPSEVRRRGDRRRRRRTAAQVVGGACAVAAVAVGAGIALDGSTRGAPEPPPTTQEPSPTPSDALPAAVTRVPDGFPLERGMEAGEEVLGPGRAAVFVPGTWICGEVPALSPYDAATDAVGVSHLGIEYRQSRDLSVYPDVATAREVADDLVGRFRGCPLRVVGGDPAAGEEVVTDVSSRELGDEAWAVKTGYRLFDQPAIGHEVWLVVRVGNALLVSYDTGEGRGMTDPEWFEAAVEEEAAGLHRTVGAMCVFAPEGC